MLNFEGSGHNRLIDSLFVFQIYLVKEIGRIKQDVLNLADSMNDESNDIPEFLKMEFVSKKVECETLQRIESLLSAELSFIKNTLKDHMSQEKNE
ncbi:hypothetical protein ACFSO7_22425 [Bacillus sp. CGMCC 1.16607]|uniref:hypothetical protein n=1 Tax=Bacillus sp. CGMCC 1.16607 TaxID=3351842 RepID=UPI00363245CA